MWGTKLLLLSFVVYVSGQGVSYYGSSNVRNQGRLPPRPLGAYRQPYQPTAYQIRPVYNPQPNYQPEPAPEAQPVYQPPSEQPASNPQPMQPPQPEYQPRPVYQPPQPAYERPSESPAPEIPPQPIYQPIPPHPAIPSQPARPIDSYPRPLPPWSWKPVQSTEAPVEIITQEAPTTTIEIVNPEPSNSSPPSYIPKAVDPDAPVETVTENIPEEPAVVLQPEAIPVSNPEESLPDIETPQPESAPEPSAPEKPTETPSTDPIADSEQPIYPDPSVPVSFLEPQPQPISYSGYPTPRPIPRPIPTAGPEISQPQSTPEPAIEIAPPRPGIGLPPIQPIVPPRPNYRPIPTAPAPTQPPSEPRPAPEPQPPRPDYQPTPRPLNPVPNPPRPIPTQPPAPRPTYEPFRPPTTYPTPVSTLATLPTQAPPRPTPYPTIPPTSIGPAPGLPDISLVIPINNFECRNGNGYYKIVNECDTYIKCENRQAYKYSCPDGLHFNPEALYPEYPCAYPSQVQCDSTASKQIPRPTNECPNRYGFFSISGGDCSKYIMCQEGKATLMNCPFGLVFNEKLSSCDWPENVPQCKAEAFNDFTCPAAPEDDPDQLTRYRYGSDCTMYIACQHGHPRWLKCDAGMSFDVNSQVCIDSDLVTGCRTTSQH